jgi:hypothetical protein
MTTQVRNAKPLINESRYPYIVELAVPDTGLEIELNRQIVSFHRSRRIQPRYGRRFTSDNQMYSRWSFSDLATAHAFLEQFGESFYHQRCSGRANEAGRIAANIAKLPGAITSVIASPLSLIPRAF